MNQQEKVSQCIINTFYHEIGNALVPIKHLESTILREEHQLTQKEIRTIMEGYKRIERVLNKIQKLAKNDFKGATIRSDSSGFINEFV